MESRRLLANTKKLRLRVAQRFLDGSIFEKTHPIDPELAAMNRRNDNQYFPKLSVKGRQGSFESVAIKDFVNYIEPFLSDEQLFKLNEVLFQLELQKNGKAAFNCASLAQEFLHAEVRRYKNRNSEDAFPDVLKAHINNYKVELKRLLAGETLSYFILFRLDPDKADAVDNAIERGAVGEVKDPRTGMRNIVRGNEPLPITEKELEKIIAEHHHNVDVVFSEEDNKKLENDCRREIEDILRDKIERKQQEKFIRKENEEKKEADRYPKHGLFNCFSSTESDESFGVSLVNHPGNNIAQSEAKRQLENLKADLDEKLEKLTKNPGCFSWMYANQIKIKTAKSEALRKILKGNTWEDYKKVANEVFNDPLVKDGFISHRTRDLLKDLMAEDAEARFKEAYDERLKSKSTSRSRSRQPILSLYGDS